MSWARGIQALGLVCMGKGVLRLNSQHLSSYLGLHDGEHAESLWRSNLQLKKRSHFWPDLHIGDIKMLVDLNDKLPSWFVLFSLDGRYLVGSCCL